MRWRPAPGALRAFSLRELWLQNAAPSTTFCRPNVTKAKPTEHQYKKGVCSPIGLCSHRVDLCSRASTASCWRPRGPWREQHVCTAAAGCRAAGRYAPPGPGCWPSSEHPLEAAQALLHQRYVRFDRGHLHAQQGAGEEGAGAAMTVCVFARRELCVFACRELH